MKKIEHCFWAPVVVLEGEEMESGRERGTYVYNKSYEERIECLVLKSKKQKQSPLKTFGKERSCQQWHCYEENEARRVDA